MPNFLTEKKTSIFMIISIISMKINPKKTKQPNKVIKFYLDTVAGLHLC